MSPADAAVIGRDLILRTRALYTKDFCLAAYLASDGTAGNDGLMDFVDCVAILPADRYELVLSNPDALINDEVSATFGEFYFVSEVTKVFDRTLIGDDDGLLDYLILGEDQVDFAQIHSWVEEDAKSRLPRLYEKFGHLLLPSRLRSSSVERRPDAVTLDDFIS